MSNPADDNRKKQCKPYQTKPNVKSRVSSNTIHPSERDAWLLHEESNRGQASPRTTIQCVCQLQEAVLT